MSSKKHVKLCLSRLREQYHELFEAGADDWTKVVDAHHEKLRKLDAQDVEAGCEAAALKFPDKFPTVPQLANLVAACARERVTAARRQSAEDREAEENARVRELTEEKRRIEIPGDRDGMERWIAKGGSDAERLARYFEAQSKQMDLDPTRPVPVDVEQERWRLLRQILGVEPPAAAEQQTQHQPPAKPGQETAA